MGNYAHGFSSLFCDNGPEKPCTVDFQLVVCIIYGCPKIATRIRACTLAGILNRKFRACANSRRDFWTTNWKSTVQGFSGPLSQKSDENRRMRAFWREF